MSNQSYDTTFFDDMSSSAERSSEVIVPMIVEMIGPRSVVDVGCGECGWLAALQREGVEDVLGIDGDYVQRDRLAIAADRFMAHDLTQKLELDRTFDLAISLEVGEHLPDESSELFVATLVSLAPAVVFSAAIPNQGGTDHVNEQWPAYWAQRFAAHNYFCFDVFRLPNWKDDRIAWYYRQNTMLYLRRSFVENVPSIAGVSPVEEPLALVHPERWLQRTSKSTRRPGVMEATRTLLGALRRCVLGQGSSIR